VYFKSGWFTWDEKLNGSSFVKEKGAMHGAGIVRKDMFSRISLAESIEVWGGVIDYDGRDLLGSQKIKTSTSYLGTKEEVTVGVKLPASEVVSFEPFLGVGHRFWVRTCCGEDWNSIYTKAGLAGEYQARAYTLYLKGGALLPIYTRNHVSLSNAGFSDVVVLPKSELSAFAEGGVKLGSFALSFEYEGMKFGQSGKVATRQLNAAPGTVIQNGQVFQPDSQSSLYSLKIAYRF